MKKHKYIFSKLESEIKKEVLAVQYDTPNDVLAAKEEMNDKINGLKFEVMKWFDELYIDSLHKVKNGSIYKYEVLNKVKSLNEMSLLKLDNVIYDYLVNQKQPISLKFLIGHVVHRMSSNYLVIMKELKDVFEEEGMLEVRYNLSYPNGNTMFVGLSKQQLDDFYNELVEYGRYERTRFSKEFYEHLVFHFEKTNEDGEDVQSDIFFSIDEYGEETLKSMLMEEALYLKTKE